MKRVLSLGILAAFLLSLGATLAFQVSAEGEEYMVWIATSGKGKKYHEEDCRTLKKGKRSIPLSKAKAMWQADVFAGELLAPIRLIKGMNPFEIAEECQVSVAAAKSQLRALDKRLHR